MEIKNFIFFSILFLFVSCSSNNSLIEKVGLLKKFNEVSKSKPIKSFNREELNYLKYPLIEIQTNGILKQALMLPISRRDNYVNYWSGSGQSITTNGSIISKTNGINIDLLSVELNKNSPLLYEIEPQLWPLNGTREHSYLNHLNGIDKISFECEFIFEEKEKIVIVEIEYQLTKIIEKCKNEKRSFNNEFWVDPNGFIWKSNQWLNNDVVSTVSIINSLKDF